MFTLQLFFLISIGQYSLVYKHLIVKEKDFLFYRKKNVSVILFIVIQLGFQELTFKHTPPADANVLEAIYQFPDTIDI